MDWVKFVCGTCTTNGWTGPTGLIVESIAGGPWVVLCSNRHQFIRTGGDVVFEIDDRDDELEQLRHRIGIAEAKLIQITEYLRGSYGVPAETIRTIITGEET